MFRILQQTKQSISGEIFAYINSFQSRILSILQTPLHNLDSRYYPGSCIPYISFLFQAPKQLTSKTSPDDAKKTSKRDPKSLSIEERLKQNLEQQIKGLLRRYKLDRIVGSGFSRDRESILFTIDSKNLVFVRSWKTHTNFHLFNSLLQTQLPPSLLEETLGTKEPLYALFEENARTMEPPLREYGGTATLGRFISRQCKLVFGQQSLGKSRSSPGAILPTGEVWYIASRVLGDFFVHGKRKESRMVRSGTHDLEKLHSMMDADTKFSFRRAGHVFSQAKELYMRDLPDAYSTQFHSTQKNFALRLYFANVRGPMTDIYSKRLQEEFDTIWRSGRQSCDVESLTGHLCKYTIHKVPGDELKEGEEAYEHCSDYQSIGSCNCGRTSRPRPDPFTLKSANYDFFNCPGCCEHFKAIELPNFGIPSWSLLILGDGESYDQTAGVSQARFKMRYKFLIPYEIEPPPLSYSPRTRNQKSLNLNEEEEFPPLVQSGTANLNSSSMKLSRDPDKPDQSPLQQRTLYKPHESDPDSSLSPRFYGDQFGERKSNRRDRRANRAFQNQMLVSYPKELLSRGGWIGYEYECPLGHRFFCPFSSILACTKLPSYNSQILSFDLAFKVELPLMVVCVCEGTNQAKHHSVKHSQTAQLQRVFIVTPNSRSHCVTINPTVQWTQIVGSKIHGKWEFPLGKQISLPVNSFICLRLPYAYEYQGKPFLYNSSSSPYQCTFKLCS